MDIQPSFKADSQLAKACKPSVLHRRPMLAQPLTALNASSGDPANDAPLPQVGSASLEVRVQLGGSFTETLYQSCNRRNRVQAPLEHLRVMPVRTADQDRLRNVQASTTMCRLEPRLPLSVGLIPVSCPPPGGLVPRSHQC